MTDEEHTVYSFLELKHSIEDESVMMEVDSVQLKGGENYSLQDEGKPGSIGVNDASSCEGFRKN